MEALVAMAMIFHLIIVVMVVATEPKEVAVAMAAMVVATELTEVVMAMAAMVVATEPTEVAVAMAAMVVATEPTEVAVAMAVKVVVAATEPKEAAMEETFKPWMKDVTRQMTGTIGRKKCAIEHLWTLN